MKDFFGDLLVFAKVMALVTAVAVPLVVLEVWLLYTFVFPYLH